MYVDPFMYVCVCYTYKFHLPTPVTLTNFITFLN